MVVTARKKGRGKHRADLSLSQKVSEGVAREAGGKSLSEKNAYLSLAREIAQALFLQIMTRENTRPVLLKGKKGRSTHHTEDVVPTLCASLIIYSMGPGSLSPSASP